MHTVFRFLRQLLLTVLLLALLALVAAGGYFAVTGHKLYESAIQVTPIDTLYSSISSREGFVPYAQLPQTYINAVISAEDSRFTHHIVFFRENFFHIFGAAFLYLYLLSSACLCFGILVFSRCILVL